MVCVPRLGRSVNAAVLIVLDRFLLQTVHVHALEHPGRKLLEKFIDTAKGKLKAANEESMEFLEGRLDDWVMVPTIDKLENWILSFPDHRVGKLLLVRETCYFRVHC